LVATAGLASSSSFLACSNASITAAPEFTDAGGTVHVPVRITNDAGQALRPLPTGASGDPGAGAFWVTISGESNALTGYPFPPNNFAADTYMVDGWQFNIDAYIVIVDKITLWSDPYFSLTNQSLHGQQVAHLDGPFVVDLHKGGALTGQGGEPEQATPLGAIANQNDNGGAAFDPSTAYGFGFGTIPAGMPFAGYTGEVAGYDAINVNLDESESADYAYMVANGASVYYRGTAVWTATASMCTQTSAGLGQNDGGLDGGYDFSKEPENGMKFRFAFSTPTNYVNCQNAAPGAGVGIGGEEFPRGLQASTSQSIFAQVTVHMDHPFWQSFAEDSPVHWDQIAAQYVGVSPPEGGLIESHIDDFRGVPFQGFTDHEGASLPWRNCSGPSYDPPGNGQMFFGTLSVPVDPNATDPAKAIRDYYDYIRYTQSTQGHLNSQGLCYIDRQFPAPPGGS
jgi:hypothetical protein